MALENTAEIQTELESNPNTDTLIGTKHDEPVRLSDLLVDFSDEKKPEGKGEGEASGDTATKAKPEMFNDLAESLGIELDDLYKLKVSTNDGETVTIEDLKALQGTQDDLTIRELEFEESRSIKEGGLRQAQSELAEVVAGLPDGTLEPAVLEKLRAKNAARVTVEQSRTLDAIPSWSSEPVRTKDMQGMISHLERFGFAKDYLSGLVDHRQIVFIRESYLREQRIQNALAKVRVGKPNPTSKTKNVSSSAPGRTARKADTNSRNGLEAFFNNV